MEMLETKKATKTEFYFQKIQTLFLLVVQPKWKEKKTQIKKSITELDTTKQNKTQRASQSRWYKRKKQIANLVTPKDLID
jgi:aspartate/glutamate racemase